MLACDNSAPCMCGVLFLHMCVRIACALTLIIFGKAVVPLRSCGRSMCACATQTNHDDGCTRRTLGGDALACTCARTTHEKEAEEHTQS